MERKQRFCLTLDLKDDPELIRQYTHWHRKENIWPEIPEGIRAVGIDRMDIFLLGTRLCMVIEAGPEFDFERDMARLAGYPRQQEWEAFVSEFQRSQADATSSEKWKMMEQIFSLG